MNTRTIAFTIFTAFISATTVWGQATDYPSRPIKLVVAYPPGGSTDVTARLIAEPLSKALGQPVVVENRPGAGGTIGASFVAKATPDGYTLLFGAPAELSIARIAMKDLPYDTLRDFEPVVLVGRVPFLLLLNPAAPPNNLREFIAWMKANPGTINYASFGNNTANHLLTESFKVEAGVDATHVPYKGSGPSITDLMGGQVQFTFDSITGVMPHVQSGRLKAIAVTSSQRSPLLPDVPTMSESGLPGFAGGTWFGVVAPKGTPAAIVTRLNKEIASIIRTPQMRATLEKNGLQPVGESPEKFATFIEVESERWSRLAVRIDLKPQ